MIYFIQFYLLFLCVVQTGSISSIDNSSDLVLANFQQVPVENLNCSFNGIELKGKVKVVKNFADIKIQFVDHFPDIRIKIVDQFPDDCGEWQWVENFPEFTVEIVDHFPDIKVKRVDHFPGID